MSKIIFYRNKCIGCGICHEQLPALWRLSTKDGKATLVNATQKNTVHLLPINEQTKTAVLPIVAACPVKIIRIL